MFVLFGCFLSDLERGWGKGKRGWRGEFWWSKAGGEDKWDRSPTVSPGEFCRNDSYFWFVPMRNHRGSTWLAWGAFATTAWCNQNYNVYLDLRHHDLSKNNIQSVAVWFSLLFLYFNRSSESLFAAPFNLFQLFHTLISVRMKLFDLSNEINRGHFVINRASYKINKKETKSRSTNRSGKQQVGLKHPWGEPDELKGDEKDKWI